MSHVASVSLGEMGGDRSGHDRRGEYNRILTDLSSAYCCTTSCYFGPAVHCFVC